MGREWPENRVLGARSGPIPCTRGFSGMGNPIPGSDSTARARRRACSARAVDFRPFWHTRHVIRVIFHGESDSGVGFDRARSAPGASEASRVRAKRARCARSAPGASEASRVRAKRARCERSEPGASEASPVRAKQTGCVFDGETDFLGQLAVFLPTR